MIRFILFLVVFFSTTAVGFSQHKTGKKGTHRLDSIKVKAGHFFVIDKEAYYVSQDTVFVVPDTVQCYQKNILWMALTNSTIHLWKNYPKKIF